VLVDSAARQARGDPLLALGATPQARSCAGRAQRKQQPAEARLPSANRPLPSGTPPLVFAARRHPARPELLARVV
jgi:hypothetical protein